MTRIKPEFYVDYHSYAKLVLYPVGWQVETYGGDTPLMETLAGTDRNPAVAGYDPDVGGELYTTNGEITDTMYLQENVLGYTVELDGGSGSRASAAPRRPATRSAPTRAASSSRTARPTSRPWPPRTCRSCSTSRSRRRRRTSRPRTSA